MASLISTIVQHFIILSIAITLSMGRPQNSLENQDGTEYQPNIPDLGSYYSYPSQIVLDNTPLDRLQMFITQPRPKYNKSFNSGSWNALYRGPETKRQVRYRQCYFNPISCFRK